MWPTEGEVLAVCTSETKGTVKRDVGSGGFTMNFDE